MLYPNRTAEYFAAVEFDEVGGEVGERLEGGGGSGGEEVEGVVGGFYQDFAFGEGARRLIEGEHRYEFGRSIGVGRVKEEAVFRIAEGEVQDSGEVG